VVNPRAKLTIYRGVGHAPFFEQPQRFNADLLNFQQGRMP
jgi:pimeloyl-ACP methyl ester carboxylesterase